MEMIKDRRTAVRIVSALRAQGKSIGFVPTMGFLHEGHLSLVRRAQKENDVVIVSIFVNPAQFAPHEDFSTYPRDLQKDQELLGPFVDYLFCPDETEIYRSDEKIKFYFKDITDCLCGVSRPHHFPGVALVLSKFFHLLQPQRVYFGQKDYQQTVVVKRLLDDLFFNIEMFVCPTVREVDGLALSSRNSTLTATERKQAPLLYQSLQYGLKLLETGERNVQVIIQKVSGFLKEHGIVRIEYVDLRDAQNLQSIQIVEGREVVLALAVMVGKTRLIDNVLYAPSN